MGNAILYRMPSGIPGDVSRLQSATIESVPLNASLPFSAYGLPGKLASGKFVPIAGDEVAADIYGFLVRTYPTQTPNADGSGVAGGIGSIMRRGFMTVKLNSGTAALGGKVYVRVDNESSGKPIGGIEAAAEVAVAGGVITGTGTGTIAATAAAGVIPGTWSLTLQTTSQTSKVTVIDPNGVRHPDATVGTAYTSGGLTFTITAAGTMTAADSFAPVVTANTIAVTGCTFKAAADASGNVEIEFNI